VRLRLSYLFDENGDLPAANPSTVAICPYIFSLFKSFGPKETLRVGIAEAELRRLWKELGINSSLYPQNGDA
jgi:hypothetical protein